MRRLLLPLLLCLAALAGPAFGAQVDYLRDVKPLLSTTVTPATAR